MADLTVTATSVVNSTCVQQVVLAGETITHGMALYLKSSDSKYWKAQHDGTAAEADCVAISLTGAAASQSMVIAKPGGLINVGATLTVGEIYMVSATAGGIAPIADIGAADYVSIIGYGSTTALMQFLGTTTGLAHG